MTAVPLVHPWGNRLESRRYRVGRRTVDLRGLKLPTDPNGLLMHGNLRGAPFEIVRAEAGRTAARLVARLDYGARPDLLRAFPFPHVVTVSVGARRGRLAGHHRDRTDRSRCGPRVDLLAPLRPHPGCGEAELEAALARVVNACSSTTG